MSLYLLVTSYVAMVLAGFAIGALFQVLGLTPPHRFINAFQARPEWNYTTYLDIAALALIALLGWRFLTTGGVQMLRDMEAMPAGEHAHHEHHHDHHH